MKNVTDLRLSLLQNYQDAQSGTLEKGMAKELANTAGKIISSLKVELEYNEYMGIKKPIAFLEQA